MKLKVLSAVGVGASLLASGCALLNKSNSLDFRYFTPEAPDRPAAVASTSPIAPDRDLHLRLGRVNAVSYLKDKIAFRDTEYEVGFYDLWQWTEKPELYLRRGMQGALFGHTGVHQILSGSGPTLDLELNAFDEVRGPAHAARVRVTWILHDDQSVLAQDDVTVERALGDGHATSTSPKALVAAMSGALGDAIAAVVAEVIPELSRAAATPAVAQDGAL